ncbi:MAG TPA: VIT1/CCC1 transporter family protein [Terriglobales bacterium]|nr:VIT1/CCC1 transporter family protein [Terriglobales bacterium]
MTPESQRILLALSQNEITEWAVYTKIAGFTKDAGNKEKLLQLAADEKRHHDIWAEHTGRQMKPQRFKVWRRVTAARLLGFTFVVKLMERGEDAAQTVYDRLSAEFPEADKIREDECRHEQTLIGMLDEERLQYVGSMVLGLNDALVELTGTLAGLTLALQNTRLVALSGLITGISATLSMASSEFLSAKSEGRTDALKSCAYTGAAYVMTVAMLVLPYLLLPSESYLTALCLMLAAVLLIILGFNYYISVAKELPFKKRFFEMAGISLGVAGLSFVIGLLVKQWLGIDL